MADWVYEFAPFMVNSLLNVMEIKLTVTRLSNGHGALSPLLLLVADFSSVGAISGLLTGTIFSTALQLSASSPIF